jgi:hypothetical protein
MPSKKLWNLIAAVIMFTTTILILAGSLLVLYAVSME